MMDKLAEKFAELAQKMGPDAIEAAKGAAIMEAYSSLAGSLIWAVFAILFYFAASKCYGKKDSDGDSSLPTAFAYGFWFCAAVCAATAAWAWIDPRVWTTINKPELWIAKKVLGL